MDEICILETALPIDLADVPERLLEPIAARPFMAKLEREKGMEATVVHREMLKTLYPDYYAPRFGVFRDRYNGEAERARLALFLKRRKVKRND